MKMVVFLVMPLLLVGCLQVAYIGQEYSAEKEPAVEFFDQNKDVAARYIRIGYAELNAPGEYSVGDLRQALIDKAEKVGANAVGVVSYKKLLVGEYVRGGNMEAGPTGSWTVLSTAADGSDVYTDSFGQEQPLNENKVKRYEIQIRADFYVTRERYEALNAAKQEPASDKLPPESVDSTR